jgi:CRP-like cAMP-binding protein
LAVQKGGETLAHMTPVEIVGEIGVITDSPRCATLQAEEDATIMSIAKARFNYVIRLVAELSSNDL